MTGAYEFICVYSSTDELRARLNALGVWNWEMGDSHWYGDYLACRPFVGVRIRICDFPERTENGYRFQADVRQSADSQTPMETVDQTFRRMLAEIGAHGIREIEWFN
jgi:hypothetical protein